MYSQGKNSPATSAMENNASAPSANTAQLTLHVLKEPRGFIRVVQFLFAILAFSTTSGFSTEILFTINCVDSIPINIAPLKYNTMLSYPFNLRRIPVRDCTGKAVLPYLGDYSSQSEYFVATGVLSFLYCLVAVALYVMFDKMYRENHLIPVVDLGISGVLALFWLTASSAWAQGVADMKHYTNPYTIFKRVASCGGDTNLCVCDSAGNFATLNVSLIFGFANFALWVAGLWFIYKESHWFKNRQAALNQAPPMQS